MSYFTCHICTEEVPTELKEDHHIVPQASGGEQGPQERLCNHCHDDLHKIAALLMNGKVGRVRDILKDLFPDNFKAQKTMTELAKIVVEQLLLKKEGRISRIEEPIVIWVPTEVKQAIKIIAKDTKRSMTKLTTDLITAFVYKQYPQLRRQT